MQTYRNLKAFECGKNLSFLGEVFHFLLDLNRTSDGFYIAKANSLLALLVLSIQPGGIKYDCFDISPLCLICAVEEGLHDQNFILRCRSLCYIC